MESDTLTGSFAARKNRTTFLAFLKHLRRRYRRKETLHIVLDNTDYRSHDEQQGAIESYLCWRNGDRPIDILDWESYCWQTKKAG